QQQQRALKDRRQQQREGRRAAAAGTKGLEGRQQRALRIGRAAAAALKDLRAAAVGTEGSDGGCSGHRRIGGQQQRALKDRSQSRGPSPIWPAVADIAGAPLFTARVPPRQRNVASFGRRIASSRIQARLVELWRPGVLHLAAAECLPAVPRGRAYVNVFQVDKASFWLAELLFLVWNSVNDYVFGWLSDGGTLAVRRAGRIVERRLRLLARFGPLLALSFALMWLRWLPAGPLCSSLSASACTMPASPLLRLVHFTALQADLTLRQSERHRLSLGASLGSGAASGSVFLPGVGPRRLLLPFRLFTTFLACVALAGYLLFSRGIRRAHAACSAASDEVDPSEAQEMPSKPLCSQLRSFSGQLFSHKNFVYFCCTQLLQVFHCHFNSNFFPLFLLLLSSEQSSTEYSASTVSLIGSAVAGRLFCSAASKRGLSFGCATPTERYQLCSVWTVCPHRPATGTTAAALACLLLSNRVFTEGVCKLLNLVVSDLVDEDYAKCTAAPSQSARLIFGSTALLSKTRARPSPRCSPALFSHFVGRDLLVRTDLWPPERPRSIRPHASAASACSAGWPLACGCVQLALWTRFSLHGDRQRRVKEAVLPTAGWLGLPHCALPLIEYLSWLYEFYGQMGKFKMTEKQLTGYREKAGAKLAEFQGLIDSLSRCASTYSSSIVMTLSVSFCVTLSKSEFFFTEMVIPALVGWYDKQDQELAKATVNSLLGLTYNMFFKNNSEIYDVLSRVGVVDSVKPYLKSSDVELQVHALILIAFALDESQADLYLGAKEVMEFLVGHLADSISRPDRRSKGYHTIELAQCVNRLALNDVNKTLLMETDLLPALLRMCSGGREDEVAAGLDILFTLSFLPANRERILAEFGDCLRVLMADQTQRQDGRGRWREARSLQFSRKRQGLDFNLDEQLSNPTAASRGSGDSKPGQSAASHRPQTARQLRRRATSTDPETVPACVLQGEHVMISYQHECKATVWIDYERMGEGSTLSAMADAVECSYAVLMCMSRKYKDSNNCRVEAEYAWRLGKKVVPLLLEQKYKPTGWLGLMLGANLYYDFSGKYSFDVKINELL
uniref:TIR domain-containing protein n=1 Tax=Macrostomum lignano TaxID=282301 RepID=A0A1I8FI03_9PLAT